MSGADYHVYYSDEAKEDLKKIYSYIAFSLREKGTAKAQTDRIRAEIKSLNQFPERYEPVSWEPWHSMNMHKVPVDSYVVFYCVDREGCEVEIVRIFYGGRDIEEIVKKNQ